MHRSFLQHTALFVALLSAACTSSQQPSTELTPQQFSAAPDAADHILLDVRTPDEWNAGHLKDAVHIDWYGADFKQRVANLDKSKPVLVYCAAGGRSGKAQDVMLDLGFKRVVNLEGGYTAWTAAGLPVVK